jgi:hypothetical protein
LIELSTLLPSLDILRAQRENDLVRIQAWDASRKTILMSYHELMLVCKGRSITFLSSVEKLCQQQDRTRISKELLAAMVSSRDIDEMEAPENRKDDDEFLGEELIHEALRTAEDEITLRAIHVSFFAAMERMGKDGLPPKQNLQLPSRDERKIHSVVQREPRTSLPIKGGKAKARKRDRNRNFSQVNGWFYHLRQRFRNQSIVQASAEDFPSPCLDDMSFEK